MSHSARSAWIETYDVNTGRVMYKSHSARSAWIETVRLAVKIQNKPSHSARSAWIETVEGTHIPMFADEVALRKECVD